MLQTNIGDDNHSITDATIKKFIEDTDLLSI